MPFPTREVSFSPTLSIQKHPRLLPEAPLVLVSNREPYVHERDDRGDVHVHRPAGGLVTGVEPLLRAAGGTWIACGSGSADRETCNGLGRLRVPPEKPEYTLRRLFLTDDEVSRYYDGFANQALWPLCHRVHTRPRFRPEEWEMYREVNRRFAKAAADEAGNAGIVLVQDYHFALVPRLIRDAAAGATVGIFWHIHWPHPEAFEICPWTAEILDGMLAADTIGFHTRDYCRNFLETVARTLPSDVDLEAMTVQYRGHRTAVRPYPISVEWPHPVASRAEGRMVRSRLGIRDDVHVSIGVDRADYTKGLLERVDAIDLLLTHHPELIGRYVHVQLTAPSRTRIFEYQQLGAELQSRVDEVNRRHGRVGYRPIVLQMRSFTPDEVRVHYAMAQSAVVTPLHDGMNLVAKEYIASCADRKGVLVLSRFAGAAAELPDAILVNPYDTQQVASAIFHAIHIQPEERESRMKALRAAVASNSIADWSRKLVGDLAEIWSRRHRQKGQPAMARLQPMA